MKRYPVDKEYCKNIFCIETESDPNFPNHKVEWGPHKFMSDGKIYRCLPHMQFDQTVNILIPRDGKKTKLGKHQRKYFCSPEPYLPPLPGGLNTDVWFDSPEVHANSLTIADIMALTPGDKIKVITLDRNVLDTNLGYNVEGVLYSAKKFFKRSKAIYTFKPPENSVSGSTSQVRLVGDIIFSPNDDPIKNKGFEFDIEWSPDNWYPLENGLLPAADWQGFSRFTPETIRDWRDYPTNTRIGWRGPMILWSKLKHLPQVYYYN